MGVFDKFLNAIRINDDDYEDDEFYDEDDMEEAAPAAPKPRRKFFSRSSKAGNDDYLDEEDDFEEPQVKQKPTPAPRQSAAARLNTAPRMAEASRPFTTASSPSSASVKQSVKTPAPKVTPIRKKNGSPMEVFVIKPVSMEDTREIADTLLSGCTVVLNLEGIDVELAQRVIDFTSGSCYSIDGSLQKVSSYIFILTPANVEISGDITDILGGTAFSRANF